MFVQPEENGWMNYCHDLPAGGYAGKRLCLPLRKEEGQKEILLLQAGSSKAVVPDKLPRHDLPAVRVHRETSLPSIAQRRRPVGSFGVCCLRMAGFFLIVCRILAGVISWYHTMKPSNCTP